MSQTLKLSITQPPLSVFSEEDIERHRWLDKASAHYETLHHEEEVREFFAWRKRMKAEEVTK